MTDYKLSLVASFDEITRNTSVLTTGIEAEFLRFVTNQEICRKQWLQTEIDYQQVKRRLLELEDENKTLTTKLKHARAQIEHEMKKRVKAEQDKESLERQIMLVRELLMDRNHQSMLNDKDREKLTFLNHDYQPSHMESPKINLSRIDESASLLSPSDISYDKTEEDLETSRLRSGRTWKRPSAPPCPMMDDSPPDKKQRNRSRSREGRRRSNKKHRRSRSAHVIATTTVTVEGDKVETDTHTEGPRRRSHRRNLTQSDADLKNLKNKGMNDSDDSNIYTNRTPNSSPTLHRINSAGKGLNRPHAFANKTVIKPETCNHCGKRIKFSKIAAKCKDCRVTAHPECKEMIPLPCIPTLATPGTSKTVGGVLADYAPFDPPIVPALIIHCVNEVESRGLKEVGIYRVPGVESEVKGLKEKFLRGRGTPNLSNINDINVVCGCIKDFLRGLKEPLVTYNLWNDFVEAAENMDTEAGTAQVYQAVSMLPQANRDTLAFLCLHLQRVAETNECKMPTSNLAKVFGPSIVGNSSPELQPMQMINETRKQAAVVEKLVNISSDYWFTFMNIDTSSAGYGQDPPYTPNTPETAVPHSTMLGPMTTPDSEQPTERKNSWFTPRFGSKSRQVNKKPTHFFTSPMLK